MRNRLTPVIFGLLIALQGMAMAADDESPAQEPTPEATEPAAADAPAEPEPAATEEAPAEEPAK